MRVLPTRWRRTPAGIEITSPVSALFRDTPADRTTERAGFRRRLVGKTLINVFHCDSAEIRKQFYQTAPGNCYGLKLPKRRLQFKNNKFITNRHPQLTRDSDSLLVISVCEDRGRCGVYGRYHDDEDVGDVESGSTRGVRATRERRMSGTQLARLRVLLLVELVHQTHERLHLSKGKGKVFPYSLPSVGPGADPGVQAVSPQVT